MKRALSFVLSLLRVFTLIPLSAVSAPDTEADGSFLGCFPDYLKKDAGQTLLHLIPDEEEGHA